MKARPSTRRSQPKLAVGDIFVAPVAGRHVCGRVLNLQDGWDLVEIFAHVCDAPECPGDIDTHGPLMPPILLGSPRQFFEGAGWRVVRHEPGYVYPGIESMQFLMGFSGKYKIVEINNPVPLRPATPEEASRLSFWQFETPERITAHIAAALKEKQLL